MNIFCMYSFCESGFPCINSVWHVMASSENLSGMENLPSAIGHTLTEAMRRFKENAQSITGLPVNLILQPYTYE